MSCSQSKRATNCATPGHGKNKTPKPYDFEVFVGGRYRTRTCDPLHVKQVLIPAELTVRRSEDYITTRVWHCQAFSCAIFEKGFRGEEQRQGAVWEAEKTARVCQVDKQAATPHLWSRMDPGRKSSQRGDRGLAGCGKRGGENDGKSAGRIGSVAEKVFLWGTGIAAFVRLAGKCLW